MCPHEQKEHHMCSIGNLTVVTHAHVLYLSLSLNMAVLFKKSQKLFQNTQYVAMVHAAVKKKLMGSLLNVITAIIDIMPGRHKTISIILQLTLASTQI